MWSTLAGFLDAVRRQFRATFFNQTPTADPLQWVQTIGEVQGTLSAKDAEGDPLKYVVTSGPSNGTVRIDADGVWTYTPTNLADFGATAYADSFTVRIAETGLRINLLKLFAPRSTEIVVPIGVNTIDWNSGLLGNPLIPDRPSDTDKFTVWNITSKTLKYIGLDSKSSDTEVATPQLNAQIPVGGYAIFYVEDLNLNESWARPKFTEVGNESASYMVELQVGYRQDNETSDCTSPGACWTGSSEDEDGAKAEFFDKEGTVVTIEIQDNVTKDIRKTQIQAVGNVLQGLCGKNKRANSCDFEEGSAEVVSSGFESLFFISNGSQSEIKQTRKETVSNTASSSLSLEASISVGDLLPGVEASLTSGFQSDTSTSEEQEETFEIIVKPEESQYWYWTEQQFQFNGTYTVKLGNTTWILKNVQYRLPADSLLEGYVISPTPLRAFEDPFNGRPVFVPTEDQLASVEAQLQQPFDLTQFTGPRYGS